MAKAHMVSVDGTPINYTFETKREALDYVKTNAVNWHGNDKVQYKWKLFRLVREGNLPTDNPGIG